MSFTQKDFLLAQSQAVKDCAKHLIKKIKTEKKLLKAEQADARHFGMFDDCGEFYINRVTEREARISVLVEQKISLEKYSKKLRHQAEEL